MIILDHEDKVLALQNLDELRNDMLNKLGEMGDIIKDLAGENRLIWERAKSYWYTSIENNLYEDSGSFLGSMVNFQDTLKELKEHVETEDQKEEEATK